MLQADQVFSRTGLSPSPARRPRRLPLTHRFSHYLADMTVPTHTNPTTPHLQHLSAITQTWFSLIRFRSPLLTESLLFSLPVGTEMFHFPTFPPHTLYIQVWVTAHHCGWVSPFGHPRISARLTAPRGLSQPPTSFIGSWCQGIHRAPLYTYLQNVHLDKTHRQKSKMLASTVQFSNNTRNLPPTTRRHHTHREPPHHTVAQNRPHRRCIHRRSPQHKTTPPHHQTAQADAHAPITTTVKHPGVFPQDPTVYRCPHPTTSHTQATRQQARTVSVPPMSTTPHHTNGGERSQPHPTNPQEGRHQR